MFAFMSLFDDVKKLLAISDTLEGTVDVDMKGSVFGKRLLLQMCLCFKLQRPSSQL